MIRTAFSTTVREAGDLSAGIFDLHGRMMAQAVTGTPGHVNSMAESVGHFLRKFPAETMRAGRSLHHQRSLARHRPPARPDRRHPRLPSRPRSSGCSPTPRTSSTSAAWAWAPRAARYSKKASTSRSSNASTRASPNETFFDFIRAGSRLPVELEGDIYSLCACNDAGVRRLAGNDGRIRHGRPRRARRLHLRQLARRATIAEIARLPRGTYRAEISSDGYEEPVTPARRDDHPAATESRSISPARPACRRAASTCRRPIAAPIPASASNASWRPRCPTTGPASRRSA